MKRDILCPNCYGRPEGVPKSYLIKREGEFCGLCTGGRVERSRAIEWLHAVGRIHDAVKVMRGRELPNYFGRQVHRNVHGVAVDLSGKPLPEELQ